MLRNITLALLLSTPAFAGTLDTPVVGGTLADDGAWPDVVAVVANNAACTGTLIAPDVVLTAGHCIEVHPVAVFTGTDYMAPHEVVRVKSAVAYPDWRNSYDVGVVMLEHPLAAKPRAVASACKLAAGSSVHIVGFGLTTKTGTGNNSRLHEADLAVGDARCTDDPACQASIAPDAEFTAGGGGKDSCFGDSGGPLFIKSPKGPALIGVVSRGEPVGGYPCGGDGVYVRADKVVSWIEKQTGRKLDRASCDRPADEAGAASEDGGCAAGGTASLIVAILVLGLYLRARR